MSKSQNTTSGSEELTTREHQVTKLILAEYTHKEIGEKLFMHTNTVCSTKKRAMDWWGVDNFVAFIKMAIKLGYLEVEDDEPVDEEWLRNK